MERELFRNIELNFNKSNFSGDEKPSEEGEELPPAIQSGRSKHKGKSTRGNHRSGLRGKGREAFSRNNWMKDVI